MISHRQRDQVVSGQRRVLRDVADDRTEDPVQGDGIEVALCLVHDGGHDDVLALDPSQVIGGIRMPGAAFVVLVVAGPGERQGHVPVNRLASGMGDLEARIVVAVVVVPNGKWEIERDCADGIDKVDDTGEVDGHEVVDRYPQSVLNRLDERLDAVVECSIDFVLRREVRSRGHPREGHERISGDGENFGRARRRINVDDFDGVAALSLNLFGTAEGSRCRSGVADPRVRADDEHIEWLAGGGGFA